MDPYIRELVKLFIVKEQTRKLVSAIDLLYINYCIKPIQRLWKKNSYLIKKKNSIKKYKSSIYHNTICKICGYKITYCLGYYKLNIREYLNCGCEYYGHKINMSKEALEDHINYKHMMSI